jgi:hypothetical protein
MTTFALKLRNISCITTVDAAELLFPAGVTVARGVGALSIFHGNLLVRSGRFQNPFFGGRT